MSKKPTKEEALHLITTWRDSLDEPRVEDGLWHDPADDLHTYFEATEARDWMDVGNGLQRLTTLCLLTKTTSQPLSKKNPL